MLPAIPLELKFFSKILKLLVKQLLPVKVEMATGISIDSAGTVKPVIQATFIY